MNQSDLINGLFELIGGAVICVNIYRLWIDKHIAGVHWGSTLFFSGWGAWNLYFYPVNGLWLSFAGGIFLVSTNTTWLILLLWYNWKKPMTRTVYIPAKETTT